LATAKAIAVCVLKLVVNLDQVGISEWEHHKRRKIIIPLIMIGQAIHDGVNRSLDHLSILVRVSKGGHCLAPYIFIVENFWQLREQLKRSDLRPGQHFIVEARENPGQFDSVH
jgi:hypothetical protein